MPRASPCAQGSAELLIAAGQASHSSAAGGNSASPGITNFCDPVRTRSDAVKHACESGFSTTPSGQSYESVVAKPTHNVPCDGKVRCILRKNSGRKASGTSGKRGRLLPATAAR